MRRYLVLCGLLIISLASLTSCQRSCGDFWEDTKTASRHVGQGVMALFGRKKEPAKPCAPEEFAAVRESEFIPFSDQDLYNEIICGDELALASINADTPIPQSRVSPGELGSAVPSIDGFYEPRSKEQRSTFKSIHFETDEYALSGVDNLQILRQMSTYLKGHPNVFVFVEGHCDERGPAAYNQALGLKRANAIRNALIKEGVHPDHVLTISYGKEKPLVAEHTAAAWKLNRRGQFKVFESTQESLCKR